MENDESRPPDPPAMAPPSEMGDMVPERPKWPTVIAVSGIVLASLGFFGGCCGLLVPFITNWSMSMASSGGNMSQEQVDKILAAQPPVAWIILASLVGLALSTLLLVGSIGLARRRAGFRTVRPRPAQGRVELRRLSVLRSGRCGVRLTPVRGRRFHIDRHHPRLIPEIFTARLS